MATTRSFRRLILASSLVLSIDVMPAIVLAQAPAPASAPSTTEEPQYINQFFIVGADGKLAPLEQQKATSESKTHNHFISVSSTSERVVANAASSVRVPPNAHFVVRVSPGMANIDPNTVIALKPFVVEKGQRTVPMHTAKAGMFQGAKGQQAADSSIPITFKPFGSSSLEIAPSQPLPPGEYFLATSGGYAGVFCFGVDAK